MNRWVCNSETLGFECRLCGKKTLFPAETCAKGCNETSWYNLKTGVKDDLFRNVFVDEFLTTQAVAQAVVNVVPELTMFEPLVLEPGCNNAPFLKFIKSKYPDSRTCGIEYLAMEKPVWVDRWVIQDYLKFKECQFNLIIGNPPYSDYRSGKRQTVVDEWVKHSLHLLVPGGYLVFLLRTNISHGIERFKPGGIHFDCGYLEEIPIAPRPNFYEEDDRVNAVGDSPSHDYSVFIWQKDNYVQRKCLDWKKTIDT